MKTLQKVLYFFVLPIIAPLLFPPRLLASGPMVILFFVVLFVLVGILLLRGRSSALTLAIFLLGLNAIIRLMMLFPHSTFIDGTPDFMYILTSILSIALSIFLVLRLDRVDIRSQMIR